MRTRSSGAIAVIFALPLLTAVGSLGQEGRFQETTGVTAVEIPVQVLAGSRPVRGLTRESFVVKSDGRRQEIVGFEVVDLAPSGVTPGARPTPPLGTPLAARRQFLLLFDLSFSDPASVDRAKAAATALIDSSLHPTDLVAVATYRASRGAEVVLGFTTDRSQLGRALALLAPAQPLLTSRDPLSLVLDDPDAAGSAMEGLSSFSGQKEQRRVEEREIARDLMTLQSREVRDRRQAEVLALAGALDELARMMGDLPGRKQVVLLSEGFDGALLSGTQDVERMREMAADSASGQFFRVDSEERFGSGAVQSAIHRALDSFRRADCAIQAVDIGGIRAAAGVRPQVGGEDGLFLMARDTGGEFFRNYNDLEEAVDDLLERTSVTYVLTIEPPNLAPDGRFHRLKVELADGPRGHRLLHRPGFYAPRPFGELSEGERRVNTAGLIMAGSEGGRLELAVLATPFPAAEAAYVPVILELDGAVLIADASGPTLPLEIYGYAIDEAGEVRDFFAQAMTFDLATIGRPLADGGVKFWGGFDLPAGEYALRILVRNRATGAAGLRVVPLSVPADWATSPCLLPPLVPDPRTDWILTQETGAQTEVPFPFRLDGEPFAPAARPLARRGERISLSLVVCGLGPGEPSARAVWLDAAGEAAGGGPLTFRSREAADASGVSRLSAEIDGPAVAAGPYELVIHFRAGDRPEVTSRIPIVVVGG